MIAHRRRIARALAVALVYGDRRVPGRPGGRGDRRRYPCESRRAKRIDAPVTVSASGVVEPMQTVAVTPQVSGTLLDVLFKEGDFVQKGQRIFRIDTRPLQAIVDQAQATLTKDMASAAAAERDDARYKSLADIGYVSRSQSDQMHAAALAAAATVQADRASLRAAQVNLGFTSITRADQRAHRKSARAARKQRESHERPARRDQSDQPGARAISRAAAGLRADASRGVAPSAPGDSRRDR